MLCLTGIGSAVFSLRAMALSTSCPDAVDATYSISNKLQNVELRNSDGSDYISNTYTKALIVMAFGLG